MKTLMMIFFGKRTAENHVKMLSVRKTGKKDHSADAFADDFFPVVLKLLFRRSKKDRVCSRLRFRILDEKGEEFLSCSILTDVMGYFKQSISETLSARGHSSILVTLEHLRRLQPPVDEP